MIASTIPAVLLAQREEDGLPGSIFDDVAGVDNG